MNKEQIEKYVREKVEQFWNETNPGQLAELEKHISLQLMQAIVADRFIRKHDSNPNYGIQNTAYYAAIKLFENHLEGNCGRVWHGHHAAQRFCQLFPDVRTVNEINETI